MYAPLKIRLEPDQLRELAVMIVEEQAKRDAEKPLTVRQFSERSGWSQETVRRRVKAGLLKKLPGHKVLIPSSELARLTHPS